MNGFWIILLAVWYAALLPCMGLAQETERDFSNTRSEWPEQLRVGQFYFHSMSEIGDVHSIAEELKRLRDWLEILTGQPSGNEPIHIAVLKNQADFEEYIHYYFPNAPRRRALFIKDRGPGMVFTFEHEDWLIDLRHECTHAILHQHHSKIPVWLDEGIAEYAERIDWAARSRPLYHTTGSQNSMRVHRGNAFPREPNEENELALIEVAKLPQLEELEHNAHLTANEYLLARGWVTYLIEASESTRAVLQSYLLDIANGVAPGSLQRRLASVVPGWEGELQQFLRDRVH